MDNEPILSSPDKSESSRVSRPASRAAERDTTLEDSAIFLYDTLYDQYHFNDACPSVSVRTSENESTFAGLCFGTLVLQ